MTDKPVIFISYAHEDEIFVERLRRDLDEQGFNPWMDSYSIEPGQTWPMKIEQAISECQAMLVVLSQDSVKSENVSNEYIYARKKKKQVIPLLYREVDLPMNLIQINYIDFQSNYAEGFKKVIATLKPPSNLSFNPPSTPSLPQKKSLPPATNPPLMERRVRPGLFEEAVIPPHSTNTGMSSLLPRTTPFKATTPALPQNTRAIAAYHSDLDEERIIIWISAFCLLLGVSVAIGILTKSWWWSVGTTFTTGIIAYLLGYHKGMRWYVMTGMVVICCAISFFIYRFVALPDYSAANAITISPVGLFTLHRTIFVERQALFGLAAGLSCAILLFFGLFADMNDMEDGFSGGFLGGGFFALILWVVLFLVATYFDWGFGYGAGWLLSLLMLAIGIIGGVGIAASCVFWSRALFLGRR